MNIIIVDKIRNKYPGLPRKISEIYEIVIHGSGGGTAKGIIDWMASETCERRELYKQGIGLFHFMIDRNGDIYEILSPEAWAYHSESGIHDKGTIGIELVNSELLNAGEYTEEQYESLDTLIEKVSDRFEIFTLSTHDYNRRYYSGCKPKPCPGYKFDWNKLNLENMKVLK